MKKFFTIVGLLLLLLIGAFVIGGLLLPNEFHVSRAVVIDRSAEDIHPLVEDLERWPEWTPWQEGDPTIVTQMGPVTRGVGATQSWTGDSGSGRLEITESDPNQGIAYKVWFDEDSFLSYSRIRYEPGDGQTVVHWDFNGSADAPIIGPYFAMMIESVTGTMFQQGLGNLKRLAESPGS
jgi:hypothetical protein